MQERVVEVEHSSLNGWVRKFTPALDKPFRQRKRAVGIRWRLALTLALGHPVGQPLDELMHMIRKGQLKGSVKSYPAQQFYSLAS